MIILTLPTFGWIIVGITFFGGIIWNSYERIRIRRIGKVRKAKLREWGEIEKGKLDEKSRIESRVESRVEMENERQLEEWI